MAYFFLALAIGFEIAATTFLKYSNGFSKLVPTALSLTLYLACHCTFSRAVTKINLGIAYAAWCGVGIVVTALISRFLFGDRISPAGTAGIICILTGCVLINLFGD